MAQAALSWDFCSLGDIYKMMVGNKGEQCSGDALTSEVTWGQLSGIMN